MSNTTWVAQMSKACKPSAAARAGALLIGGATLFASVAAIAEDWSDTSIGWRHGTRFSEPYDPNNIVKNIFNLEHVGGYKWGTQYFNVDLLQSNGADPASGNPNEGAQEAYVTYRNTLDLGKITGSEYKFGPVRGIGGTFGFDWNTKNDAYGSKKRMAVVGPTLMFDVPGFLNVSVLAFFESNAPNILPGSTAWGGWNGSRYTYDTHAALSASWGIPIGDSPFNFQGYFLYIGSKGPLEQYGSPSKPETHFDGAIMLDVGRVVGGPKGKYKLGFEYEYWKNKFGNDHSAPGDSGAWAKTPMIRAEYHF
jgi:nucleoside-specific outer membrane channel protein Tsx